MKTLLIPTNFTDISRHAMDYVLKLYKDEKLKIILLNSFEQPRTGRSMHLSLVDIMRKNSIKGLNEDQKRLEENYPDRDLTIETRAGQGTVASCVKSILNEVDVDLIVMGSKGDTEFMDIFVESQTARLIRVVDHPMLIVPPIAEFKILDKIILTTDQKPISDPAKLSELINLCKQTNCEVKVLNVSKGEVEPNAENEKRWDTILEGISHDYSYRRSNDIPKGIYKFILETNADIVTMVRRKGGGKLTQRFFQQSVSRKITKHVRQTLLLFTDRDY